MALNGLNCVAVLLRIYSRTHSHVVCGRLRSLSAVLQHVVFTFHSMSLLFLFLYMQVRTLCTYCYNNSHRCRYCAYVEGGLLFCNSRVFTFAMWPL